VHLAPVRPLLSLTLGASDWQSWLHQYVIPIAVVLFILLVPHLVAAQVFAPKANVLLVIAACVMQTLFIVLAVFAIFVLFAVGVWYFAAGAFLVFLISAFVMCGLYRFDVPKGLGYTAIAFVLAAGALWAVLKFYPEPLVRGLLPLGSYAARIESRRFQSEADAQRAAVQLFPQLAVAGSDFNRRFLEKHRQAKAERPDELGAPGWPWVLAKEVDMEMKLATGRRQSASP
jgi:hypothetical protein